METIERLEGEWDFVFIDADKRNYSNYFDFLLPRMAARGLMAFDNTLWSGAVLEDDKNESDNTRAIKELNDRLASDPRVTAVLLTVRDGVTLVKRNA